MNCGAMPGQHSNAEYRKIVEERDRYKSTLEHIAFCLPPHSRTELRDHFIADIAAAALKPRGVDSIKTKGQGVASQGVELIAAERDRHPDEGWSDEHDDHVHDYGDLSRAACSYALDGLGFVDPMTIWPWSKMYWKPKSRIENLVRAGALIAAEIDRLLRLEENANEQVAKTVEPKTKDNSQMNETAFISAFNEMASVVHQNAVDKGFWEGERNDAEAVALIHSEASELLEGLRHGNPPSDHIPEFSAVEEELADLIIRALDFAKGRGHRVGEAVLAKHAYNKNRPRKHGKKF